MIGLTDVHKLPDDPKVLREVILKMYKANEELDGNNTELQKKIVKLREENQ
jgi:hypothetical protein